MDAGYGEPLHRRLAPWESGCRIRLGSNYVISEHPWL